MTRLHTIKEYEFRETTLICTKCKKMRKVKLNDPDVNVTDIIELDEPCSKKCSNYTHKMESLRMGTRKGLHVKVL